MISGSFFSDVGVGMVRGLAKAQPGAIMGQNACNYRGYGILLKQAILAKMGKQTDI